MKFYRLCVSVFVYACLFFYSAFSLYSLSPDARMFFLRLQMMNETENCPLAVRSYVYNLPKNERIAQLFLVRIPGNEEFSSATDYNDGVPPGGFIFFKANLQDEEDKIIHFTDSVKFYYDDKNKLKPYLALDHEGGNVNRLRSIATNFPSQNYVAQNFSKCEALLLYENQAQLLKRLGFNVNLAPVAEVLTEKNQDFLETRSFGSLEQTANYASLCSDAYISKDVISVLKHFPGNTNDDPHYGLPNLAINEEDFVEFATPFSEVLSNSKFSKDESSVPFGILISHAIVGEISDYQSACFSKRIVTEELREKMKFSGIVFSDDVYMAALQKIAPPEVSCEKAILAGVDVIMMTGMKFLPISTYLQKKSDENPDLDNRITESCCRIVDAKRKMGFAKIEKKQNDFSSFFESFGYPPMYDYDLVLLKN